MDSVDGTMRLTVHLYVGGEVTAGETRWALQTDWPWEGKVRMTCSESQKTPTVLRLRKPAWAGDAYVVGRSPCRLPFKAFSVSWLITLQLKLNGQLIEYTLGKGYITLPPHRYEVGDEVTLDVFMQPRRLYPHPLVHQSRGCVAIARGPLVYSLESVDQGDSVSDLRLVKIDPAAKLQLYEPSGFDRHMVGIKARGSVIVPSLLRELGTATSHRPRVQTVPVELRFIPYFAWGNRGPSDMRVWIAEG
jgi:uncharacterized protein